jgi:hypothetical protein
VVAPTTLQLSVEDSPAAMVGGPAPNEFMAGGCVLEVTVIPAKSQPAANTTASTSRIKGTSFFISHLLNFSISPYPAALSLVGDSILYIENYYKVIKSIRQMLKNYITTKL